MVCPGQVRAVSLLSPATGAGVLAVLTRARVCVCACAHPNRAPCSFGKTCKLQNPIPMLVPFYIMSASSQSPYTGKACPAADKVIMWKPYKCAKSTLAIVFSLFLRSSTHSLPSFPRLMSSGTYEGNYQDVLLCALEDKDLNKFVVTHFNKWDLRKIKCVARCLGPLWRRTATRPLIALPCPAWACAAKMSKSW